MVGTRHHSGWRHLGCHDPACRHGSRQREAGTGAQSNSIVVNSRKLDDRRRVLILASHAHEQSKTNVSYWCLDVTKHAQ